MMDDILGNNSVTNRCLSGDSFITALDVTLSQFEDTHAGIASDVVPINRRNCAGSRLNQKNLSARGQSGHKYLFIVDK